MILSSHTTITVTSNLQEINTVLPQFNRIHQRRIVQQDWLQCQLALVEGFTNAVRHAHRNLPPETPIVIAIAIYLDRLIIKIWDRGEPFDLQQYLNRQTTTNRLNEGGRGISLMYKIADEISYERISPSQNCLQIVKYLKKSSP